MEIVFSRIPRAGDELSHARIARGTVFILRPTALWAAIPDPDPDGLPVMAMDVPSPHPMR